MIAAKVIIMTVNNIIEVKFHSDPEKCLFIEFINKKTSQLYDFLDIYNLVRQPLPRCAVLHLGTITAVAAY